MAPSGKETLGTFEAQSSLKPLPVPKLKASLEAYLESVRPLLSDAELAETSRLAADFAKPGGEGEKLQALLEAKAAALVGKTGPAVVTDSEHPDGTPYPDNHWLERWWETYAYQSDRMSLAVNINCFQSHFKALPCDKPLERGAWAIRGALDGRRLLRTGAVPPERAGKSVMCSAQYHRVFATTRIPGEEQDSLHTWVESTHVCVERRGHWYTIDNAETLSVDELRQQLEFIKNDAAARAQGPGVAALTGQDRTVWARARRDIMAASPNNARTINEIESAIFHLVLSEDAPQTPDEVQRLGCHGNGAQIWFDKSQTHLLFENGALITNLEHSSADAVVPARMYVYIDEFVELNAPRGIGFPANYAHPIKAGVSGIPVTLDTGASKRAGTTPSLPRRADLDINPEMRRVVAEAREYLAGVIDDNIVTCLEFPDFGAKTIAQRCKGISTDSFVQMSLALAFYRDQGQVPVPYETASTRGFLHGRTETIRPQSIHMKRFLEAFADSATPRREVAEMIRAAADHHRNYLRRCMSGNGVDRHLMGLRLLAAENGMPMHPLFQDLAYTKSTRFTLSTSQMPWAVEDWPGFGAYDPAAYACCYRFTHRDTIVATVASRRATGNGKDAVRFRAAIEQAFRDIMEVLGANPPAPASKL